jgi:hypothetical protein
LKQLHITSRLQNTLKFKVTKCSNACSRVLLEMLIAAQLARKFPGFYATTCNNKEGLLKKQTHEKLMTA